MSAPDDPPLSPLVLSTAPTIPAFSAVPPPPSLVQVVLSSAPTLPTSLPTVPSSVPFLLKAKKPLSNPVPPPFAQHPMSNPVAPPPPSSDPLLTTNPILVSSLPLSLPYNPQTIAPTQPSAVHAPPSQQLVSSGLSERKWTSLFKRKPRNAGKYIPVDMSPVYEEEALVPPKEVLEAGAAIWNDTVVGFFLDKPLSYTAVVQKLKFIWKLKGTVKVKSDGTIFLFNFTCCEDRESILQSDPIIMNNKLFIIKPYDATVSNVTGSVTAVPVWVHMHNLPIFAWSPLGINWLCSHLGKMLCMDEMTEKQDRLSYAKCLIEIRPDRELVEEFMVKLVEGGQQKIYVQYLWQPDVCVKCRKFGHKTIDCDNFISSEAKGEKENGKDKTVEVKEVRTEKEQTYNYSRPVKKQNIRIWQRVARKKIGPAGTDKNVKHAQVEGVQLAEDKDSKELRANDNAGEQDRKVSETEQNDEDCVEQGQEERRQDDREEQQSKTNMNQDGSINQNEIIFEQGEFEENICTFNKFDILSNIEEGEIISTIDRIQVVEESNVQEAINESSKGVQNRDKAIQKEQMECTSEANQQDVRRISDHLKEKAKNVITEDASFPVQIPSRMKHDSESDPEELKNEKKNKRNMKNKTVQNNISHKKHNACVHNNARTSLNDQNTNSTTALAISSPVYFNLKPPSAFKPPPPINTPTTSPPLPILKTPPSKNANSAREVTPLSVDIPNYLNSSQAMTRSMKIEIINARALQ
jgi:hypothetical protein